MASITEVARLAGVSVATASRVVSEADYPVSPATRERVLEAARTLDYVPNELARGMLGRRVPVVGVIVHDITDPYFAEVVRGVEDAAADSGYLVITCSSERDAGPRAVATSGSCAGCGRRRWCSRAPASTTRRATRRWTATSRRCAPRAPPWSTSRPTRGGGPGRRRGQRGRDRVDGRGARGAGSPADRVPRRAAGAVRRAGAARRATGAGSRRPACRIDERLVVHTGVRP